MSLLVLERGMPGRPQPRQAGAARAGHRRALVHRRPGTGREPSGRGRPGVRPPRGPAAAGAAGHRRRRCLRRPRVDARARDVTRDLRTADRLLPEQPVQARRGRHRGGHRLALRRRLHRALNVGDLSVVDAAKAKWWCSELQGRVVDTCLQLHGGYGYMTEYPIARAYADARIFFNDTATTEIMKEVVGRDLGL